MMKISAAEFKEYSDQLSDDWYFDGDIEIPDNFIEGGAPPDEILEIERGDVTLVYQGNVSLKTDTVLDLVTEFNKWRKNKTHTTIVITVPKVNEQKLREAIKVNGGVVV